MKEILIPYLLLILAGFLLGGVMFSALLPRYLMKVDVRSAAGDHNPGAANVFSLCGIPMGVACLLLDLGKGFLPAFAAWKFLRLPIESPLFSLTLAAPVLGHALAPFSHRGGGKCIAASFGALLAVLPFSRVALILAALYLLSLLLDHHRDNRVRSQRVFAIFGVLSAAATARRGLYSVGAGCVLIAATAVVRHSRRHSVSVEEEPVLKDKCA